MLSGCKTQRPFCNSCSWSTCRENRQFPLHRVTTPNIKNRTLTASPRPALVIVFRIAHGEVQRREIVSELERKHHKLVWEKQAWGPPTDVFADEKPNDSILYPYVLTVEFSLSFTYRPIGRARSMLREIRTCLRLHYHSQRSEEVRIAISTWRQGRHSPEDERGS